MVEVVSVISLFQTVLIKELMNEFFPNKKAGLFFILV